MVKFTLGYHVETLCGPNEEAASSRIRLKNVTMGCEEWLRRVKEWAEPTNGPKGLNLD